MLWYKHRQQTGNPQMTLSLKESIQEGLIRSEMTQMLPQWISHLPVLKSGDTSLMLQILKESSANTHRLAVLSGMSASSGMESSFMTWYSALNLSEIWSEVSSLTLWQVLGLWRPHFRWTLMMDVVQQWQLLLWGFCLCRKDMESRLHLSVPCTYPQVLVLPLKPCRSPVCVLCTPLAVFFLSTPLHAGSLWFLAQVMNFNSLAEPFSESEISLGLKMSNWIGCQVIAGLQKPRTLTRKASVLLRAWLARETSVAPPYPEVWQPSTPCLSLWLHCEVALLSKV